MEKDRLDRLEDKIDKISDKLTEINIVMAENTQSLIVHEKRTDLAEKKIDLVEIRLNEQIKSEQILLEKIDEKLQPIQSHVSLVNAFFKYFIPAAAATLAFLYKIGIFKL
jgi:hypothetical protein